MLVVGAVDLSFPGNDMYLQEIQPYILLIKPVKAKNGLDRSCQRLGRAPLPAPIRRLYLQTNMKTNKETCPNPLSTAAVAPAEPNIANLDSNHDDARLEAEYAFGMAECMMADSLRRLFNVDSTGQICHTPSDPTGSQAYEERRRVGALLYAHGKCVECFEYSWEDVKLVCFRFLVAGELFSWHHPAEQVPFQYVTNARCSAFRLQQNDRKLADLALAHFRPGKLPAPPAAEPE